MIFFILLFALSIIGVSETAYLIRKRMLAEAPVCPIGGGCEMVLTSKYNKIFFVPNDMLGFLSYVIMAFLIAFFAIGIQPVALFISAFKILVAVASLMSVFLTYIQWRIIRAWCFWCLMSAFTIWLMGVIILINGTI
ncbi:MAG: vitamin K epoxide reductase family protein [Patescibacteria group bacterium]